MQTLLNRLDRRLLLPTIICLLLPTSAYCIEQSSPVAAVTVVFCNLVKQPESYDNLTIRVRAVYRYGFEWSELFCLTCPDAGLVWVELGDNIASNTKKNVMDKVRSRDHKGRILNVVVVGTFYGKKGGYGHLGAYKYKFVIRSFEMAEVIMYDSPSRSALPKKVRNRAKC